MIDRIKGGLTVDVGLRAFLPGSLVDIKPIKHLESLKGEELEFKVISLDRRRNNIVLSRKAVLEKEYAKKKTETLDQAGRGGADCRAWSRTSPTTVCSSTSAASTVCCTSPTSPGDGSTTPRSISRSVTKSKSIILKFDPETERVSLGYKQKSEDPWTLVDKKYPIGSRVRGKVVSAWSTTAPSSRSRRESRA